MSSLLNINKKQIKHFKPNQTQKARGVADQFENVSTVPLIACGGDCGVRLNFGPTSKKLVGNYVMIQ